MHRSLQERGAIFVRIFMAMTGGSGVLSGGYLAALSLWRVLNPDNIVTRGGLQIAAFVIFIFSFVMQCVCWILLAFSHRLWNNSASAR